MESTSAKRVVPVSCNKLHICSFYCEPAKQMHAMILFTTPNWTQKDVEQFYQAQNIEFQVRPAPELTRESMQGELYNGSSKHTLGWLAIGYITILEHTAQCGCKGNR